MRKGAIERCKESPEQFISSYFLIPKKDDSFRFVLNLKKLNNYINTKHFQMEDLRTAIKLISRGTFMTTVDLKDAHYLFSVAQESRKYLRFIFEDQIYEFTRLPFGLNVCPFLFTKMMKAVIGMLREKGFLTCIYLDDILCLGNSRKECTMNTRITI